jgi:hypothetical protein
MVQNDTLHHATCACGHVQLHSSGEPRRVGLCHCLDCRKVHGAPFWAFAIFSIGQVAILSRTGNRLPNGALSKFESSKGYGRFFCSSCGSHLFRRGEASDEIEVSLGSFNDTNLWTPTYEAWSKRREAWLAHQGSIVHHFVEDRLVPKPNYPACS